MKEKKLEKDKSKTEREVKNGNPSSVIILSCFGWSKPEPAIWNEHRWQSLSYVSKDSG